MRTRPELYDERAADLTLYQPRAAETSDRIQLSGGLLFQQQQQQQNITVNRYSSAEALEKQFLIQHGSLQTDGAQDGTEVVQRIGVLHESAAAGSMQDVSARSAAERYELSSQRPQTAQAGFFKPGTPFFGLNRTVTDLSESSSDQQAMRGAAITHKSSGVHLITRGAESRGERGQALFGGSSQSETSSIGAVDNWSAIQVESRSRVFSGEFQLLRTPRQDAIKKTGMRAESVVFDAVDSVQNSSESGASSRAVSK